VIFANQSLLLWSVVFVHFSAVVGTTATAWVEPCYCLLLFSQGHFSMSLPVVDVNTDGIHSLAHAASLALPSSLCKNYWMN
jgi:hypothetical protein